MSQILLVYLAFLLLVLFCLLNLCVLMIYRLTFSVHYQLCSRLNCCMRLVL